MTHRPRITKPTGLEPKPRERAFRLDDSFPTVQLLGFSQDGELTHAGPYNGKLTARSLRRQHQKWLAWRRWWFGHFRARYGTRAYQEQVRAYRPTAVLMGRDISTGRTLQVEVQ